MIINASEPDGWQFEKFTADFARLRVNGALPQELIEGMHEALETTGTTAEQKNPAAGFKSIIKDVAEVAPQISSIVGEAKKMFDFGAKKKEPPT